MKTAQACMKAKMASADMADEENRKISMRQPGLSTQQVKGLMVG